MAEKLQLFNFMNPIHHAGMRCCSEAYEMILLLKVVPNLCQGQSLMEVLFGISSESTFEVTIVSKMNDIVLVYCLHYFSLETVMMCAACQLIFKF